MPRWALLRHLQASKGLRDDALCVRWDAIGTAAKEHQELTRLRPGVVGRLVAEATAQELKPTDDVVIATHVGEVAVRHVVEEALREITRVVGSDDADVVQLVDQPLAAPNYLLVSPSSGGG